MVRDPASLELPQQAGHSGRAMPEVHPAPEAPVPAPRTGPPLVRSALLVLGLLALLLLGRAAGRYVPQFAAWVHGSGAWGPVVFMLGYAVATVAFVPGVLLTLAAGAIFGLAAGVMYVFIAATIGAAAAFLVSRYVARGAIERRLASNAKFAAIDRAVGAQGRWIVFLLRLSPVFPFNLLNYALGLTRVRFTDYVVASVGMLPGTLLYVVLRQARRRRGGARRRGRTAEGCRILCVAGAGSGGNHCRHHGGDAHSAPRLAGGHRWLRHKEHSAAQPRSE